MIVHLDGIRGLQQLNLCSFDSHELLTFGAPGIGGRRSRSSERESLSRSNESRRRQRSFDSTVDESANRRDGEYIQESIDNLQTIRASEKLSTKKT